MEIPEIEEIAIERLDLSVRSYNCLKINNIDTLDKLLVLDDDELYKLKNLGKKSLEEIENLISKVLLGEFEFKSVDEDIGEDSTILEAISDKDKSIQTILFKDESGAHVDDIEIENMSLSVRSKNGLKRGGYISVSELMDLEISSFNEIKNLGEKSKKEIIDKLKEIVKISYNQEINSDNELVNNITNILFAEYESSLIEFNKVILQRSLYQAVNISFKNTNYENIGDIAHNEYFIKSIYNNEQIRGFLKNHIIKVLLSNESSTSMLEIKNTLPKHIIEVDMLKELIIELENDKSIELFEGNYRVYYQSLNEYICSLEKEREKLVLTRRLEGYTLEEIGLELNITREYVRQIEKRIMNRIPRVKEDYYKLVFEKYNWNEEMFKYCYNESKTTYIYLNNKCNKGVIELELFLEDSSIDPKIRIKAEKIIFKNYITIGSSRIKKSRNDILSYILRTFCKDEVSSEELSDLYYMFLEDYELNEKDEFKYPSRYFETTLANSKKVLWKYGKKLRSYNFDSIDEDTIYTKLNLQKPEDVEYSTLKIFRDYKEIMDEWDIRDEYELHNLMKKVFEDSNKYNIKITRMPNLEFGNVDRDMQVLDLLLQMAPIDNETLANEYEKMYGVKSETALANYFMCIDEYLKDKIYSIDFELLPNEEFNKMKEVLSKDIYLISDVKKIYKKLFPKGNLKLINTHNLKRLGFRVNTEIIYTDRIVSAERYFKNLILEKDIFDANLLDAGLTLSQTYYVALQSLRTKFEIIEFSPNIFINIRRLEEKGIFKEILLDYIDKAYEFIGSGMFTIKYLRKKGFEHKLDDLGFEDHFYSSLLTCDSRFRFRKLSNNILLSVGQNMVSLADLVEHIVCDYRKMDIYDLVDYTKKEYGIKIERHKIQQIARDRDLYYDSIMEKVYIDYDEYFEEV